MELEEQIRTYPSIVEFNNLLLDQKTGFPFTQKLLPHVKYWDAASSLFLPIKESFPNYLLLAMGEEIIDHQSLQLADIVNDPAKGDQMKGKPTLFSSLNHTTTALGNATLLRSLVWPLTDKEVITAKQDSLRELESNDCLRQALEDYISEFNAHETSLFTYLSNFYPPIMQNSNYRKFRKAAKKLAKLPRKNQPESFYLDFLVKDLRTFTSEEPYNLMRGPVYRTFTGLQSKEQRNFFLTPRWRYYPYPSWTILPMAGFCASLVADPETVVPYLEKAAEYLSMNTQTFSFMMTFGIIANGLYSALMKTGIDSLTVPLPSKITSNTRFQESMDSIGKIDELLSFYHFGKNFPHPTTLPNIRDDPVHSFTAKGLTNPTLGMANADFVPNDIFLDQTHLNTLTGPNSGGKTTICKSALQNQVLGQIGSRVTAREATINIADRIAYQAPSFDALANPEGRYGTEMEVTKGIYFSTTPKSFVILDELAEGTTMEERMEQSYGILDDFYKLKANVIWVTHNHQLAEKFKQEGKGQQNQVEFKGEESTYSIIPGISKVSHADRVMKKIGFTAQDRANYRAALEEEGRLRSI